MLLEHQEKVEQHTEIGVGQYPVFATYYNYIVVGQVITSLNFILHKNKVCDNYL